MIAPVAGKCTTVAGIAAIVNGLLVAVAPPQPQRNGHGHRHGARRVLCLYLLLGLFFAFTYTAIQNLGGARFFFQRRRRHLVALGLLQLHHDDDRRLPGLHRTYQSRAHAGGERGAARSDLPCHGRRGDRQPFGPPRRPGQIRRVQRARATAPAGARPLSAPQGGRGSATAALPHHTSSLCRRRAGSRLRQPACASSGRGSLLPVALTASMLPCAAPRGTST